MSPGARSLNEVLRSLLGRERYAAGLRKARLVQKWESIVGPRISAVSRPIDVRGETLLLEVEDPVWRSEISLLHDEIVECLAAHSDIPRVRRIRCVGRRSGGTAA
jgi:predicted nucleic acid-binding Zn ribbon protein